jgi:hypothetical protein
MVHARLGRSISEGIMNRFALLAVLALVSSCGSEGGGDAPDAAGEPDAEVLGMDAEAPAHDVEVIATRCCLQYPSGLAVPGCWMCADGVLRCVTTACQSASSLPLCSVQPVGPYTADHPDCQNWH